MEKNIFQEFAEKFNSPWKHVSFNLYVFFIVVGFGGLDIWTSVYELICKPTGDIYSVAQNLGGFFVAIIAASVIDLYTALSFKNMLSLQILSVAIFGVSLIMYAICYLNHGYFGFIVSLVGSIAGIAIWIVANSDNEKWSESTFYNKMRGAGLNHGEGWQ
jgi:hypothetical protein